MSVVASQGYRYARCGPIAKVVKLESFDIRLVKQSDVLVQMVHAPLHRTDAAIINGTALGRTSAAPSTLVNPALPVSPFPRIGGVEGLGKVVNPGTAEGIRQGDLVWVPPFAAAGTWATTITADAKLLVKVSKKTSEQLPLPLLANATCLIAANRMLKQFVKLQKGNVVVQNGGSSLVSLAVSALAGAKGCTVITGATPGKRFDAAAARHKAFNSTVFPYTSGGVTKQARKLVADSKGSPILFLNGVGGRPFNDMLKLLGDRSFAITYGAQNSFGLMWSGTQHIWKDMTIAGFNCPRQLLAMTAEQRASELAEVVDALAAAKFTFPTVAVKLAELPSAWDRNIIEGGQKFVIAF